MFVQKLERVAPRERGRVRGCRHCERSEAIHLAKQRKNGLLRCARNDVKHKFALSRHDAPELFTNIVPPKSEGAGKAGCPLHPRPRVVCSKHAR